MPFFEGINPETQGFVTSIAFWGTLGFLVSRLLSGIKRTLVDNLFVLVFSLFLALLLCMVISLGWTLSDRIYGLIAFFYVFFMDKGRMISSFLSR